METQIDEFLVQERLVGTLSGFFDGLVLLLACIGLYGVMSYTVVRRTNEIGIRMALGAQPRKILWRVLRETLGMIVIGLALGLPAALAATRLASNLLFGVTPTDPMTICLATFTMLAVGLFAGYLPARRASRVDPMVALRYE